MQRYISNTGVPRNLKCDQAQAFRVKQLQVFCNSNNLKPHFAPVRDHRSVGVIERVILILKRRLGLLRTDLLTSIKPPSNVAARKKTSRNTPHGTTQLITFETHEPKTKKNYHSQI